MAMLPLFGGKIGHYGLNGQEFEQTLGDSEGQGSLVCSSPWVAKSWGTTERLNDSNKEGLVRSW